MSKRLLTILYPGFAEWEVVFPLFCVHPAIEAVYVSLDGRRVRGAMGFDMQVKGSAAEVNAAEFAGVYLPGGIDSASGRFPRQLADHEGLLGILRAFDREGRIAAAICGAPLVLGAAGLLDGRRFVCEIEDDPHGWFDDAHRAAGTWVVDGHVLTGSLCGLLPFTVALARLLGEEETAREIGEAFDLEL